MIQIIWAALSAFRSRFFVIAIDGTQTIEHFYNRNDKKSSTQVGLRFATINICHQLKLSTGSTLETEALRNFKEITLRKIYCLKLMLEMRWQQV